MLNCASSRSVANPERVTLRIAWFATAKGTSSRLLLRTALDAIRVGQLDAEIVCVVCNRAAGHSANTDAFLDDVRMAGIPLIAESARDWRRRVGGAPSSPASGLEPWRRDYDRRLLDAITPHAPEVGMLAGYMMILTDVICEALPCLNLHPALPDGPIGAWQDVIRHLIRERAERSGMTLQRVTTELDRGPTVTWAQYPIRGTRWAPFWRALGDGPDSEAALFRAIREAGVAREPTFVLQSLQAIASEPTILDRPDGREITESVEAAIGSTVD